jgi:hypothetical protein
MARLVSLVCAAVATGSVLAVGSLTVLTEATSIIEACPPDGKDSSIDDKSRSGLGTATELVQIVAICRKAEIEMDWLVGELAVAFPVDPLSFTDRGKAKPDWGAAVFA